MDMLSCGDFSFRTSGRRFPTALPARPKPCVTADEATKMINKDVCITAHVYEVVELPDGTRFLDICTPETPDERCRFTIVSFWEDHDLVGELRKYREHECAGSRDRALHARTRRNGGEPCTAVLRRAAKVQAEPATGARIQRRAGKGAPFRSQPAYPGRGRSFMNFNDREPLPKNESQGPRIHELGLIRCP